MAEARRRYEALEDDARSWLREGGFESDLMRFERAADLRYARRQRDMRVAGTPPRGSRRFAPPSSTGTAGASATSSPTARWKLTKLRVVGIGVLPPLEPVRAEPGSVVPEPASTGEAHTFGPRAVDEDPADDGSATAGDRAVEEVFGSEDNALDAVVVPAETYRCIRLVRAVHDCIQTGAARSTTASPAAARTG